MIGIKPEQYREYLENHYGQSTQGQSTPYERVNDALNHMQPDRVPFDFRAVPEIYSILRSSLEVNCDEEVLELLGIDLRWVGPDYTGPAPCSRPDGTFVSELGLHLRNVTNAFGGVYQEHASYPLSSVQTMEDVDAWRSKWVGWVRPEYWDVGDLKQEIENLNRKNRYYICYDLGGIFELSWSLYGLDRFLMDLVLEPELPCAIMDCVTDFLIAKAIRVLDAADGMIDMVYTFDDVGTQSALLMSETMWREYILPRHQRLNHVIRQYPVKIMYHSCGAVFPLIRTLAKEMDIDVLNPLQPRAAGMDMPTIKRTFGGCLSFHGGIDVQHTLPRGSTEEVTAEVRQRCGELGANGGYICAPAHNIQSDTPLENIIAMYTTPREYLG